jgi:Glycerophosphoryl diester phosphodiesterase family
VYWPRPAHRPLICAHRGLSAGHEDNSADSFRAAYQAGADAVECDVRVTADGELFCWHDRRFGAYADINTITARQRAELGLCALDELLAIRQEENPAAGIFFDTKTVAATTALLAAVPSQAPFLFGSFSDLAVTQALEAGWPSCYIDAYPDPFILLDLLPDGARLGANFYQAGLLSDAALARSLVGTVDSPEMFAYLSGRGTWTINTNDCAMMVKLFGG